VEYEGQEGSLEIITASKSDRLRCPPQANGHQTFTLKGRKQPRGRCLGPKAPAKGGARQQWLPLPGR
jgi:hypothetical protein